MERYLTLFTGEPDAALDPETLFIKTNLTGYTIVARAAFQPVGDPAPGNQSPFLGKSPTSVPKIELEINWKTAAATRNIMTNFFLEIFMLLSFSIIKVLCNTKLYCPVGISKHLIKNFLAWLWIRVRCSAGMPFSGQGKV